MKIRPLLLTCLLLGVFLPGKAQVFIINDNILTSRMSDIKAAVVDSLSGEPVSFASVYVIPSKDTTITNFTLSDAKGQAKLEEVPFGSYVFHVEMMGYKPFVKERFFREAQVDMGTIRLQQDERFLQAAVVSDIGNPIVVKQDTVEFNASSFRVGANAMLKDLLQRMPGMEITSAGKVKFNGEEIDKLTVGGRTFFFDDQSTALNNLPASVVDKIRVIDRESEATRATGIQDGNREKVLDVALKKEYEQGWFGNIGLKGGTTVGTEKGEDPLRDDRGLLYNGNALVSAYTEKDQVTVIANGQNINDSNGVVVIVSNGGETTSSADMGLSTAAQLGVNANSSRIKDVETTASANYKFSDSENGTRSLRTTHQEGQDLYSVTEEHTTRASQSFNANVEFEKEKGKVWFHVRPSFSYSDHDGDEASSSQTSYLNEDLNRSESATHSVGHYRFTGLSADVSLRDLGGKKSRVLQVSGSSEFYTSDGDDTQVSVLRMASGAEESRSLNYLSDGTGGGLSGSIRYVEPFGETWTLTTRAYLESYKTDDVRDAFDAAGRNDYYSSESNRNYLNQQYDLTAQYRPSQQTWFTLGASVTGTLNELFSKSYGISETTGKGQWFWFVAPTMRFSTTKGDSRYTVSMSGYSQRPNPSQMIPVLNIANPSRLTLGNIYLKPYGYEYINADWSYNNREKFSTAFVSLYATAYTNQLTYARWYDSDGIMYAVPVNSEDPSITARLNGDYSTPLDSKKVWTLSLTASASYSSSTSYQSKGTLDGLDRDDFDYSKFMAGFWGGEAGERFYGGQSGFARSATRSIAPQAGAGLRYNHERLSLSANANVSGRIVRYSLNPSLNMNTLTTNLSARGSYTTDKEWEFSSNIAYLTFKGYSEGYDKPEMRWNAEISKNIGAFNLSLTVHDILDQTRNLTHTVTANYEEDTYRLIMGRYVLFGVKWNFGKMNAAHSQRARSAAINMIL